MSRTVNEGMADSLHELQPLRNYNSAFVVVHQWRLLSHDFKGLKTIAELKDIRRRLVVFQGGRPCRTEDGIDALPIRDFLEELEGKTM
jgi:hypothetical protein